MMDRYKDFWQVTEDGLAYSARSLKLDLTAEKRERLMRAYLTLASFPDVQPGLEQLKAQGLRLAILSNGEPKMLQAAATSAGIAGLLDTIHQRGRNQGVQAQPARLPAAVVAPEHRRERHRLCLIEQLGRQRRRLHGADHLLDSARGGRAAGGDRVPRHARRWCHHRPSRAGSRLMTRDTSAEGVAT